MANDVDRPDPQRLDLAAFARLLGERKPIAGEDPGSFDTFHAGLMRCLAPETPYEAVIAENLVAIEWELVQARRMRDAGARWLIAQRIRDVVMHAARERHETVRRDHMRRQAQGGLRADEWEEPDPFDREAAEFAAADLAERAMSSKPKVQAAAYEELRDLAREPLDLMCHGFDDSDFGVTVHEDKIRQLERRRREVKRDYDDLVRTRPIDGVVTEA